MSTRTIPVQVNNEYVQGAGVAVGAAGSHNDVVLEIAFSPLWDGLAKKITWLDANGENATLTILTTNMLKTGETTVYQVPIPAEPKAYAGELTMTIKGATVSGSTETRATLSTSCTFRVLPSAYSNAADESGDVTPTQTEQLQAEIDDILETISNAEASATAAAASETAAAGSATLATEAKTAAEAAQAAAETAETNAETAEASAETAKTAAETAQAGAEAAQSAAETAEGTATIKATEAGESAAAALASKNTAAGSAATAVDSAATAVGAAADAQTAQEAAEDAQSTAEASAASAASSASTATTKAGEASTSATNAATSAADAAQSAQQAAAGQVNSDWNVTDTTSKAFILHKPTIPTVPTNVSAFTNDAGYLKSHQDISGKLDKTGDGSNVTAAFTQAAAIANIATGEKLSVLFGKIKKYFADLKTVAFTGAYSDLSGKPTSMTPTAHTHTKSQITDFPTSMTPTSHSHAKADITDLSEPLLPRLTVTAPTGSTVTCAKDSTTLTATEVSGAWTFDLPDYGTWTVTATLGADTENKAVVVDQVKLYTTSIVYLDDTFSANTWEAIVGACQSGSVPAAWVAGNQKAMTINGASYTITIIGKNHDTYTAGGTAPLTFQLQDCYGTKYQMNSSNTNSGGWTSCAMRSTHLPAILALMPTEVKAAIQEVNKLSSAGGQSATINTTADKLFLLSEIEISGSVSYSMSGEGSQYAYYSAGNSKVKNCNGSAAAWWERSPHGGSSTAFCFIADIGTANTNTASASIGVAFGFCF